MTYDGHFDNNVKYSDGKFPYLSYLGRHKSCSLISYTKFKISSNRSNYHSLEYQVNELLDMSENNCFKVHLYFATLVSQGKSFLIISVVYS